MITCLVCGQPISPDAAMVFNNQIGATVGHICSDCEASVTVGETNRRVEQWARSLRNNPLVHDQNDDEDEQRERFASYGQPGDRE